MKFRSAPKGELVPEIVQEEGAVVKSYLKTTLARGR
jgi:hypothetical protein